jgi:hypothetical protein
MQVTVSEDHGLTVNEEAGLVFAHSRSLARTLPAADLHPGDLYRLVGEVNGSIAQLRDALILLSSKIAALEGDSLLGSDDEESAAGHQEVAQGMLDNAADNLGPVWEYLAAAQTELSHIRYTADG